MKVAVVGPRIYPDLGIVQKFVELLPERLDIAKKDLIIVSGGARGVDSRAAITARNNGFATPIIIKPRYKEYPKKLAPLMRNSEIVEECDFGFSFFTNDSIPRSGTKDVTLKLSEAGKLASVYCLEGINDKALKFLKTLKYLRGIKIIRYEQRKI